MAADLPPFLWLHDGLKERAKNGGRNARPIEARAGEQRVPHIAVEIGKAERFGKQIAIDVRECRERFVKIFLSFLGGVLSTSNSRARCKPRSDPSSAVRFNIELESFALENAGVLRKEAKQNANQKAFQFVAGIAASFQGIVEVAHNFDGLNIDRVLFFEFVLLVAGDECEVVNVAVKLGERKFGGGNATHSKRGRTLFFGLQIVQGDAGEIGNDDIARNFIHAPFPREVLDVAESLRSALPKSLPKLLCSTRTTPGQKQINVAVVAGDFLDRLFKARHDATANTEDIEEFIPESLLFRLFALGARPFLRKGDRAWRISFQEIGMGG